MNWFVKWGVKKYLLEIVNKALAAYNVNVDRARAVVARYAAKVETLLAFLKSLDEKLADGRLTEAEADDITDEAIALAGELVK
ncbi:MAG: hypothetical protein IJ829_05810 [Kiritimatiellae bacterium]|nr:hypothetical protein [Kiritimatiellia bacterium]